jgi:eukaryotic-like serine/threonine-protein kinase
VDPDIERLVKEERLLAAAELAWHRGQPGVASELYERACAWKEAAVAALAAGDAARALPLAIAGGDDTTAEKALAKVAGDKNAIGRVAARLERRGDHGWCARMHEAAGDKASAAKSWERAGDAVRAARLLEGEADVVGAARVLEAAVRRDPTEWSRHVALGGLLLRYGKAEAAARALQKVAPAAPERRQALTLLVRALDALGLGQAHAEAMFELGRLGGPLEPESVEARPAAVKARLFGRYEVLREVASSPSARVVECIDGVRSEHVAVKVFAAYDARGAGRDALARFEREVKVLATLDHPNVVPLRDYIPEGPAIALMWMNGGTLEKRLADGALSPARAVEVACAVLSALGEAHRLGVLHRDVKPANVLFDDAGVARLGDFGVAHLGDLSATATAGVIGTLAYMSPEQREGKPATLRSDLYGVGVMLLEMLTGERPEPPEPPRTLPSGAHRDLDARHDALVLRMVAPEPEGRPADAFTARRMLTALPWPSVVEPAAPKPAAKRAPSEHPRAGRLIVGADGVATDSWIGRAVERVPLTERTLARARAFARAGHRALQAVLRVDREGEEIWLEPAMGEPAESLTRAQAQQAHEALDALHAAGAMHGAIDRTHVLVEKTGGVVLRFTPDAPPSATVDTDRLGLARLSSPLT